jgi:dUTP pyrophosphatase
MSQCVPLWYPQRATPGAAGYDIKSEHPNICEPSQLCSTITGFEVSGNRTTCLWKIAERSGLALKRGIFVPNTVVSNGNIVVQLFNGGTETFKIEKGDRIAQLLTVKCYNVFLIRNEEFMKNCLFSYARNTAEVSEAFFCKFNDRAFRPIESDVGYMLQSPEDYTINPNEITAIKIGIGITTPNQSTYWRVANFKTYGKILKVCAGVIDSDYRGEIAVIVKNITNEVFKIHRCDPVCYIICEKIFTEDFHNTQTATRKKRNDLSLDFPIELEYKQIKPYFEGFIPQKSVNGYNLPLNYDIEIQPKSVFEWELPIRVANYQHGYWFVSSLNSKLFILNDILDDSIIFYNGSDLPLVLLKDTCYVSIHCIKIDKTKLKYVENFNDIQTVRGENGFGSTEIST